MTKANEDVPYVTKANIEAYLALEEERLSLQRQAADKAREAEVLHDKIEAFTRAKGGAAKSVERSGFVLAIKSRAGTPAWKAEFIRVAGADEAERLVKEAPRREFLSIEAKR